MQDSGVIVRKAASVQVLESAAEVIVDDADDVVPGWGLGKLILCRFVFVYLVLYMIPFPLNLIPGLEPVSKYYDELWKAPVTWVGKHLFHVTVTVVTNGSGDTTFNYVQVFCYFTIASFAAAIWSVLDRKRTSYRSLYKALRVCVRYSLATTMITYGFFKVIKSQFPNPSLDRLIQPFGDASPMGLLWTFMGASESFNIFTGAGEVLGGLLLTTRRTTLLGALVSFGVLSHVAMLNFSYDVPVKLFSLHLLAMCLFLMAPDLGRIARLFLLNGAVEPVALEPLMGRRWVDRTAVVIRTILVFGFVGMCYYNADQGRKTYGDLSPRSPLYGIWTVEEFEVDGKARPPLLTDKGRWRRVIFDHPKMVTIQLMTDKRQRYILDLDTGKKMMTLSKGKEPAGKTALTYEQPEPGLIALEGTLDGQKIQAKLRRTDPGDFLLINRGFHWINEFPFNR
jgi:hypothetical protein